MRLTKLLRWEPYPRLSLSNHLMSVIRIFFLFLFVFVFIPCQFQFNNKIVRIRIFLYEFVLKRLFVDVVYIQDKSIYTSIAILNSSNEFKFKLSVFVKMMVESIIGEDDPFYEKLRQTTTTATATTNNSEATELQVGFVFKCPSLNS